jgi:hypothetical protein
MFCINIIWVICTGRFWKWDWSDLQVLVYLDFKLKVSRKITQCVQGDSPMPHTLVILMAQYQNVRHRKLGTTSIIIQHVKFTD